MTEPIKHAVEQAAIATANKVTLAGGGTAAVAGVAEKVGAGSLDIVGMCGLGLAVLGYLTSLYFQWRRDRREHYESNWRMGDPDRRGSDEA